MRSRTNIRRMMKSRAHAHIVVLALLPVDVFVQNAELGLKGRQIDGRTMSEMWARG